MNLQLNLVAIKTLVRKEVTRVFRIWVQTLVLQCQDYQMVPMEWVLLVLP